MAILWCGGEDIDFPNGTVAATVGGSGGGTNRAGWSRCSINFGSAGSGGSYTQSTQFPGGAVTSAWFTCQLTHNTFDVTGMPYVGVSKLGSNVALGICCSASTVTQATLMKWNGSAGTVLATQTTNSFTTAALHRLDMQISNFGTSATVNMYIDGNLVISFTGDVTVTGFTTGFDCIYIGSWSGVINYPQMSEFIVSTTDSRAIQGLVTLALSANGDTNLWTSPTYSNINTVSYSDTSPTSTNTVAQDNMYKLTALPSGTYAISAVKQTIRAAASSGATATHIKMGYKSEGTVAFGTGSTKTPTAAGPYTTFEQYDATNPVTSASWTPTDVNALQLDFQSS